MSLEKNLDLATPGRYTPFGVVGWPAEFRRAVKANLGNAVVESNVMKTSLLCVASWLLLGTSCFAGYAITNGDFESATVVLNDPNFGFLDWSLAAPGWGHSPGDSTDSVYYKNIHIGWDQWFLLVDHNSNQLGLSPLQGNYSLAMKIDGGGWNQNYLTQTCTLPLDVGTISLLVSAGSSYFDVQFNNEPIGMVAQGDWRYSGDISRFAGQTVEIKIINQSPLPQPPDFIPGYIMVDDIRIEPKTVPEPATWCILTFGLAVWTMARPHRRRY
ncbi:MAG TPA: hypothetical protein DD670_03685 [Planctomycetaceae bacterium]|nr:hypothetical protein [Planctomycetaceae bacterium]